MSIRRAAVCLAVALSAAEPAISGQEYFGQNKVQYKNFDFRVLRTEHFDIYFYPEEREGIDISARLAERWYARLQRVFSYSLSSRQPLVLYGSHPDFEQTNAIPGQLSEGTGGVTEPLRRRIVLPLGGPIGDTDHVIGHELVHAFQFDMTRTPKGPPGQNGAERLPLWFIEGMAEYLSLGPVDPNTAMWMRDAAREVNGQKLPSIRDLNSPKYFPYRWGQAFWAYVGGRWGDDKIKPLLAVAASSGDMDAAFTQVLGTTTKEFSADWQAAIRSAYAPILQTTMPASEIGTLVIKGDQAAAQLNVGPTISPDGRLLAFLSARSFFSIDLFIAETRTGKIVRQLTSTATDPHYSSIQFIYSAGAWDHDSTRIAIATITGGRPALAIFNATSGNKDREVPLPSLDEVFNPTWSPDGRTICFTGMSRGLTDLYLYDLDSSSLHPLTHDPYADLMPAWSPDGKRIAFATDRFTTHLDTLHAGEYRIALIDPATGSIEQVRAFTDGKNINPQWAPDGASIYFVSDRDGIPNLYRVALASGDVAQLTRVGTGLSGITNTSPTLSVSSSTGVAAFSVYQEGKYDIYTIDDAAKRPAAPLGPASMTAATLPPLDRKPGEVAQLLADASFGLPAAAPSKVDPYRPTLSLEGVAQPAVAVGTSRFGTAISGGIALQFGDMLGNRVLATAVQLNSGFGAFGGGFDLKNTAAEVGYFNQAHRWNWGVLGGQVPYLTGGFASALGTVSGEPAEIDQTIIFRQTEQSAAGVVSYPFNRASRVEFQGGISRISFDQIVQTTTFSLNTGQVLTDDTATTPIASALTLGTASAAYVHDTSNYGATSPVAGERYRLEASPTVGSIDYVGLTADYRRYFMPVSFYTIATRVMHYGRYGSGAEDQRLFPLYLGYPNLVRGYDVNTFNADECVPSAASACPIFDRLVGSRVLVGNLEFRFPLLRPFGVSSHMYGPVPVEVALFADGGIAWNDIQQVTVNNLLGIVEQPHGFNWHNGVSSAGVALRVNLFGYAVGEFDFTRPFQRPRQGLVFQFNLTPGF
jgi:Tol biopolymer transport system component